MATVGVRGSSSPVPRKTRRWATSRASRRAGRNQSGSSGMETPGQDQRLCSMTPWASGLFHVRVWLMANLRSTSEIRSIPKCSLVQQQDHDVGHFLSLMGGGLGFQHLLELTDQMVVDPIGGIMIPKCRLLPCADAFLQIHRTHFPSLMIGFRYCENNGTLELIQCLADQDDAVFNLMPFDVAGALADNILEEIHKFGEHLDLKGVVGDGGGHFISRDLPLGAQARDHGLDPPQGQGNRPLVRFHWLTHMRSGLRRHDRHYRGLGDGCGFDPGILGLVFLPVPGPLGEGFQDILDRAPVGAPGDGPCLGQGFRQFGNPVGAGGKGFECHADLLADSSHGWPPEVKVWW